jgi:integrative and conjugative element protein (TIGR02256 family)
MEWVPGDGMFGFLQRLLLWFKRASAAKLTAPGEPLHPPVAYGDPASSSCVVVHADAPPDDDDDPDALWLGAALLRQVTPDRADALEWLDQQDLDELWPSTDADIGAMADRLRSRADPGQADDREHPTEGRAVPFLGLAVILPEPLSFEFPRTTSELTAALERQGLDVDDFVTALGEIALLNEYACTPPHDGEEQLPTPPLYVFVGAPMRGIGGADEHTTHLAAWRLHADYALALSYLPYRNTADGRNGLIGEAVTREFQQLLHKELTMWWEQVHEQRPEVVTRRDRDSPARWLLDKRVLVLGCGALGAPIAEQCVRAGAALVTVVDKAKVNPGVLVRQPYEDADIGRPKATVLAERLMRIRSTTAVKGRFVDAIGTVQADPETLHFDLVVDATASPRVATKLEQQRCAARSAWPAVASVAIGHTADLGVATLSLPGASGGGTDILRRLSLAGRVDPVHRLDGLLNDLYPDPPRTELFHPEPGCSEPTFVGSATQVVALASHLFTGVLSMLAHHAAGSEVEPMSAYVVSLGTDPDAAPSAPVRVVWANDLVHHDETTGYEVRVSATAVDRMRVECRDSAGRHGRRFETGGPLFGEIDEAARVVWVSEAREPPSDSHRSSGQFVLGTAGLEELSASFDQASGGAVRFIGAWHTHPDSVARQSMTDREGMEVLVGAARHVPYRALLMILGGDPHRWSGWLDQAGHPDVYVRLVTRPDPSAAAARGSAAAQPGV